MSTHGAATGLAVVVTVYASHAVPGVFIPGARDAFLTAATLSGLAFVAAIITAIARARPPGRPERQPSS